MKWKNPELKIASGAETIGEEELTVDPKLREHGEPYDKIIYIKLKTDVTKQNISREIP